MNLKMLLGSAALAVGLLVANVGAAQAPAGAPAGATGLCNDGTYFKGTVKSGACTGHKGLKTWYGVPAKPATKPATAATTPAAKPATATPAATPSAAKPATAAAPAAAPAAPAATPAKATSAATAQAPGGGPGMVWVNTASNVYHCPGTQYYGKTKAGKYMTEAAAKGAGAHPVGGKPCGK